MPGLAPDISAGEGMAGVDTGAGKVGRGAVLASGTFGVKVIGAVATGAGCVGATCTGAGVGGVPGVVFFTSCTGSSAALVSIAGDSSSMGLASSLTAVFSNSKLSTAGGVFEASTSSGSS